MNINSALLLIIRHFNTKRASRNNNDYIFNGKLLVMLYLMFKDVCSAQKC